MTDIRERDPHTRAVFDAIVDAFLGLPLPSDRWRGADDAHRDCLHLGDLRITLTYPDGHLEQVPDSVELRRHLGRPSWIR
jgi:hypothetical protein